MSKIDSQTTIAQLVLEKPSRSRIFEKLGIDYCCGGQKPLSEACQKKGLDAQTIVRMLEAMDDVPAHGERDWTSATLTELADHIEGTHHAYLKQELPRLEFLVGKVSRVHGDHHPELVELNEVFNAMKAELESHMMKEEQILFPICRQLEQSDGARSFHCGSVANPIRVMIMEHDNAGDALERMNALTGGYTPPADACNSYRAMMDGLAELERDMHQHVHKENNILFPRTAQAEQAVAV
jgi:regulator of cell morphogenesis and NO signaling